MLDSILEFITQAASNPAFIFCFCNLIIVFILVDLKPSIKVHQEGEAPLSMGTNQKQGTSTKYLVQKDTQSQQMIQVSHVHEAEVEADGEAEAESIEVDNIETVGNDDCSSEEEENHEEEEEDEDDDELRRRVEEFIEKVNKGWKEELLRTSRLV